MERHCALSRAAGPQQRRHKQLPQGNGLVLRHWVVWGYSPVGGQKRVPCGTWLFSCLPPPAALAPPLPRRAGFRAPRPTKLGAAVASMLAFLLLPRPVRPSLVSKAASVGPGRWLFCRLSLFAPPLSPAGRAAPRVVSPCCAPFGSLPRVLHSRTLNLHSLAG